jgi:hypothetical protein
MLDIEFIILIEMKSKCALPIQYDLDNDVELSDGVCVFVYVNKLWHDNHVAGCWCELYMLNVDW